MKQSGNKVQLGYKQDSFKYKIQIIKYKKLMNKD